MRVLRVLSLLTLALGCTGDEPTQASPIEAGELLEVAADGVTLWYNQPSAVRYVGRHDRTYFAWLTSGGAVQVRYYDHRALSFSAPVTVHQWDDVDDHSAPAIEVVRSGPHAGRVLLAFAFHSSPMLFTRSIEPERIDQWAPVTTLHDPASYPRFVSLESGTTVLLFRSFPAAIPNTGYLSYAVSLDGGTTWSAGIEGIRAAGSTFVYGGPGYASGDRVGIAWSIYDADADRFRPDVYYAELDPVRRQWFTASGTEIGSVVTPATPPVLSSPDGRPTRVWDANRNTAGEPHVAFVSFERQSFPCCGGPGGTGYWAKFSAAGNRWTVSRASTVSRLAYAGGVVLDSRDPRTVYVAEPVGDSGSRVVELHTSDDGARWTRVRTLSNEVDMAGLPQPVRNGGPELPLTWLHVHRYDGLDGFLTTVMAVRLPGDRLESAGRSP